jgi:hypothetical protein
MSAGKSRAWSAFTFSVGSKGFHGSLFGVGAGFSAFAGSPGVLP